MKIGLLTLPFNNNYGGYLQCYALMTVLKQMGHNVELIYRRQNKRSLKRRTKLFVQNIISFLSNKEVASIIPDIEKEFRFRGNNMMSFVDKYIAPKSRTLYSTKKCNTFIENRYDAVIVGSDQVWRPEYVPNIRDFFLCGIKDTHIKRVAYAASFGLSNPFFNEEEKNDCGSAIEKFAAVSVREDTGVDVIKKFGWKCIAPQIVLDPTLLLSQEHYNGLLPEEKSENHGKICCYVLDWSAERLQKINEISKNTGLDAFYIFDPALPNFSYYKTPSIENWLSAIRDSEMVVTDSYHGIVFSIIFQKTFIFLGNTVRGNTRIDSLFRLLGINSEYTMDIDYHKVLNRITDLRVSSVDFIKKSLK